MWKVLIGLSKDSDFNTASLHGSMKSLSDLIAASFRVSILLSLAHISGLKLGAARTEALSKNEVDFSIEFFVLSYAPFFLYIISAILFVRIIAFYVYWLIDIKDNFAKNALTSGFFISGFILFFVAGFCSLAFLVDMAVRQVDQYI